ncbi:MAG: hypothetical protein R3C26_05935 [Calditrichia bacterium]
MGAAGSGGSFFDQGNGIATDGNGNTLVTGKFSGNAAFGDTTIISLQFNTFVAKYDANGNFMWAEKAGGQPADFGSGISGAADGSSVATGYFQGIGDFGGIGMTSAGSGSVSLPNTMRPAQSLGAAIRRHGSGSGLCIARDDAGDTFVSGFCRYPQPSAILLSRASRKRCVRGKNGHGWQCVVGGKRRRCGC